MHLRSNLVPHCRRVRDLLAPAKRRDQDPRVAPRRSWLKRAAETGCPQDQLSEVVAFSFGKKLKGTATHDLIVRLGLTRKAVSTIDPRYDENAVPPVFPPPPPCA